MLLNYMKRLDRLAPVHLYLRLQVQANRRARVRLRRPAGLHHRVRLQAQASHPPYPLLRARVRQEVLQCRPRLPRRARLLNRFLHRPQILPADLRAQALHLVPQHLRVRLSHQAYRLLRRRRPAVRLAPRLQPLHRQAQAFLHRLQKARRARLL